MTRHNISIQEHTGSKDDAAVQKYSHTCCSSSSSNLFAEKPVEENSKRYEYNEKMYNIIFHTPHQQSGTVYHQT